MIDLNEVVAPDERLVALSASRGIASGLEAAGTGLSPKEKIELLSARLASAPDPDLAREIVTGARSALAKVGQPDESYTRREVAGLEAVVLTVDRPSLTIQDGFVNFSRPEAELFSFKLLRLQDAIRKVIGAVGRINAPTRDGFAGTVIYIGEGRVITNRHVLEAIARQGADGFWTLRWPGATTVDFVAEFGIPSEPEFRVAAARFWGSDPIERRINFAHLDLAILDMEPIRKASWPDKVCLEEKLSELTGERSVYAVGYPGRPQVWKGDHTPTPGYELLSVIEKTFNSEFRCKKFAPGQVVKSPGTLDGDYKKWVFAHDCSTLRGNSGSAVVEFTNDGGRVLGVHFGGLARSRNWGHSFAALKQTMVSQGASYCV